MECIGDASRKERVKIKAEEKRTAAIGRGEGE